MKSGYIVVSGSMPCGLSDYGDGPKVLTLGGDVALFSTYDSARAAIRRTNRYSEREGLHWNHAHRIFKVVPEPTRRLARLQGGQ